MKIKIPLQKFVIDWAKKNGYSARNPKNIKYGAKQFVFDTSDVDMEKRPNLETLYNALKAFSILNELDLDVQKYINKKKTTGWSCCYFILDAYACKKEVEVSVF